MTALWTSRLVVAPLKNVPTQGYDVAAQQAEQIKARRPDRVKCTEGWDRRVQQAFRDVFGDDWNWQAVPGESGFMGCDTNIWRVVKRWRFIDMAADPIPGSNDGRDVLGWALRDKTSKRELEDYVVHANNLPTIKAPWLVDRARQEQREGAANMTRRASRRSRPQSWDGDFNQVRAVTGPDVLRRGPYRERDDDRIIHSEMHHGKTTLLRASSARPFGIRGSDHPALLVIQRGWAA